MQTGSIVYFNTLNELMDIKVAKDNTARNSRMLLKKRRFWISAVIVLLIILIIIVWHHHSKKKQQAALAQTQNQPVPVALAQTYVKNVPVYFSELGSVTPIDTVTVKTQVAGTIFRIFYKEGQIVKAGDLLVLIDPRPFQAQILQFQGQLERDRALLGEARMDLKRYQSLFKNGGISRQTYEDQVWVVKQLEGTIKLDQGQLQAAQVNLIYTHITAPSAGRVGLRLVDVGNYVTPSDTTGLLVITSMSPITVIFTIPEDNIPLVLQQMSKHQKLLVQALNRDGIEILANGYVLTIDNQVDLTTGMVKIRALFPNKDYALFPNQFVNARLLIYTLPNALVVPTAAVQTGTNGAYVFLYQKNNTVNIQQVTTGVVSGGDTVIVKGLVSGQQVVIEGTDKLKEGSKVSVANSVGRTT